MRKLFVLLLVYTISLSLARGDQCELIPQDVATKAYDLLITSDSYTYFCAPCMDREPVTEKINKLDIQQVYYDIEDETLYTILINDKPIDIAYIYINGKNLGMQVNCTPISYVPEYIDDFLNGRWQLEETSL